MTGDGIRIERLGETEHFYTCMEVQRRVWGMPDHLLVPAHLLIAAQRNGGLVLGAFNEEGEMVGFLFGFLGTRESTYEDQDSVQRLKHCSHMVGVLPEYHGEGIGYLLKLRQREHALSQGLDLVTWTYDPLESANANLNICKLGVICNAYLRDIYGELTDGLNVGLATDRFQVEWWVTSKRVAERIRKGGVKPSLEEMLASGAKRLNVTTVGPGGLLRPSAHDLCSTAEDVIVEVPADFQSIKGIDMSLADDWRRHTREIFEHCLAQGYVASEFIAQVSEGSRRSYYVLRRGLEIA